MGWRVVYYISPSGDNPVGEFISSCAKNQQVKILRILNHLEEYGICTAIPHIKKLTGTPFWEIRVLGKDNIRIIYVTEVEKKIIILHGFFKKTKKTSRKEFEICFKRHEEFRKHLTK